MTFTLVADGTSDRVLMRIIEWSLRRCRVTDIHGQWADPSRIRGGGSDLSSRVLAALDLFPCDVLFIHRDAENQVPRKRREEIAGAARNSAGAYVPVIPVRMTEAWLLVNEAAIRRAAGNPNGKMKLDMPALARIEKLSDPKSLLHSFISSASGLNANRRSSLPVEERIHLIAEYIDDFSPLEALTAFQTLQRDIEAALRALPGAVR